MEEEETLVAELVPPRQGCNSQGLLLDYLCVSGSGSRTAANARLAQSLDESQ